MTLKEKFDNLDYFDSVDRFNTLSHDSDKCVQIADDYAIEFAEWIDKKNYGIEIYKHLKTYKEVLQIFKKEKGL